MGLDCELLESVQASILALEPAPPAAGEPARDVLFSAFRRATEALVVDIERSIKLLGTPERAQARAGA